MKLDNMHQTWYCLNFKGLWGKTSEKEDSTIKEAWKHLKPVLHCGQKKMEFRATGHTAADLQLDIGIVSELGVCNYKSVFKGGKKWLSSHRSCWPPAFEQATWKLWIHNGETCSWLCLGCFLQWVQCDSRGMPLQVGQNKCQRICECS